MEVNIVHPMTESVLTPARRRLLEMMRQTSFGRIEGLVVHEGDPVFDPPPTVVRLFLFGRDDDPIPARSTGGFALKRSVEKLFEVFDRERSFTVRKLMIDNGLPVRMTAVDTRQT